MLILTLHFLLCVCVCVFFLCVYVCVRTLDVWNGAAVTLTFKSKDNFAETGIQVKSLGFSTHQTGTLPASPPAKPFFFFFLFFQANIHCLQNLLQTYPVSQKVSWNT